MNVAKCTQLCRREATALCKSLHVKLGSFTLTYSLSLCIRELAILYSLLSFSQGGEECRPPKYCGAKSSLSF
ncbi:hypothetical protein MES5069_520060 [Mesorhizobium escarrei]|uniref:Uncharacterized protein n=1 Tax=Mesorhizobium escarrei TaxID=666018 RepID=A0ABN8KCD1_9HYPH|nr:hypothetical protein MES5069_520060 [Mesorhizobium escarrei]